MNKNRMIGILTTIIVISGILIAFFPFVQDLYQQYMQRKLLEEYQSNVIIDVYPLSESADFLKDLSEVSGSESGTVNVFSTESEKESPITAEEDSFPTMPSSIAENSTTSVPTSSVDEQTDLTVIGTIQIPKVEINMPIFKYSNQYQMDFGAVHVAGTTEIGKVGNCGIAAHRGRAKWYFFNRLNELVEGDSIFINYNGGDYEYIVYETMVVLPTQVEVLNRSRTKKILTLITCDPPESDRYRLIIHAILK